MIVFTAIFFIYTTSIVVISFYMLQNFLVQGMLENSCRQEKEQMIGLVIISLGVLIFILQLFDFFKMDDYPRHSCLKFKRISSETVREFNQEMCCICQGELKMGKEIELC